MFSLRVDRRQGVIPRLHRVPALSLLAGIVLAAIPWASSFADQSSTPTLSLSGQSYSAQLATEGGAVEAFDLVEDVVAEANEELLWQLREDFRVPRDSLVPLAQYLNLLFPELDIGAPESLLAADLNETQIDALLNLYVDLVDEQISVDADRRSYLQALGFSYPEYLARRLSEKFQLMGECLTARLQESGNALVVYDDPDSCTNDPRDQTIWVNRFLPPEMQGASIDAEAVAQLLEEERRVYMGSPDDGIGGYPPESLLGLVQALGTAYAASGYGTGLPEQARAPVVAQLELMRRPRGVSFEELKSVSLELQNYLRRQGFFLANAYIPQQDFRKATGEVSLDVSFGTLGDVTLRNDAQLHHSKKVLLGPFSDYMGQWVSRDIYEAYFAVNDLPGVHIRSGLFEPGDNPGETRLVLDVEEERFRLTLSADNYGSEFTGEERAIARVDWHSPLGRGDSLGLGILQSIDPNDSTFGFVNYSIPVFDIAHELAFSWDTHEYDSIDNRLGSQVLINGDVESFYAGYDYKWRRSKSLNVRFGARVFDKQSDTSVQLPLGGNAQISEQKTSVNGGLLSTDGDVLLRMSRTIVGWQATVLYGEQDDNTNLRVADDYIRFSLESKSLTMLPWGPGADFSHLSARLVGAYSDDVLPSFEQTPLGGPFGVRAFASYDFTADTMAYLGLEWQVDVGQHLFGSWVTDNSLRVGVFAEAAWGEANGIGNGPDSSADMSGYGLLMKYGWRDSVTVSMSLAFPGHDSASDDFSGEFTDDDSTFLFDVRYEF